MYGPTLTRRLRLDLEHLETRDTPAGTVNAVLSGTTLTLIGDDADNAVQLNKTPGGIEVVGINATQVTGGVQPFAGVIAIRAVMKDGNDTVFLDPAADLVLSGISTFDLGDGDNVLQLSTTGKLDLGGLTVLAGDGLDKVTIAGGPAAGSLIRGNLSFALGIGRSSQEFPPPSTTVQVQHVDVLGVGGLKLVGTEGGEEITLDDVTVAKAVNLSGGHGTLGLITTGSQIGSLLLTNVAPALTASNDNITVDATDTTVTGSLSIKTAGSAELRYQGGSTGNISVVATPRGSPHVALAGTATVNGNLTLKGGGQSTVVTRADANVNVTGDISITGTQQAGLGPEGPIHARNIMVISTERAVYDSVVSTTGGPVVNLSTTGSLTLRGRIVLFQQLNGEVTIGGGLSLLAGVEAQFETGRGSFQNGPVAKTSVAGPVLIQGRRASYTQTESEATFAAGVTIQGTEEASFASFPWRLPGNPDFPPFGAGAKTTVAGGMLIRGRDVSCSQMEGEANFGTGLTIQGTESAFFDSSPKNRGIDLGGLDVFGLGAKTTAGSLTIRAPDASYSQDEGDASFAQGLSIIATGPAEFFADAGQVEVPTGAKLSVPSGSLLVQGAVARYFQFDGETTVSGGVTVKGSDGVEFDLETLDSVDNGKLVVGGSALVDGGVGTVDFTHTGNSVTVGTDMVIAGQSKNSIRLAGSTGTQVGRDLKIAGARGDADSLNVGGNLTVVGNTSVAFGNGANDIAIGVDAGTIQFQGALTLTTGSGADVVKLASVTVAGPTTISTGAGTDRLHLLKNAVFNGLFSADLGGGADILEAGLPLLDSQNVQLVPPGPVTFNAAATVKMGIGNDLLRLGLAGHPDGKVLFGPVGSLTVDGGANLNAFDDEAGQFDVTKVTTLNFIDPNGP
ncbi:MAG TPA: hypothetical protein VKE40_18960 [Gemmataceae bacterium]|nr:hypothetical protein [Gemmataceae bacterium]